MTTGTGRDDQDRGERRDRRNVRWLIDGMNLIGSRPDRWWNDPDRAVRRLIGELDRYADATGEDVTVVFDRQPADVPAGVRGAALVAFASRHGRNAADDEIIRMLADDPAPHSFRVVTSDRRLVERARQLGAGVTSSSSFRRRMDEALAGEGAVALPSRRSDLPATSLDEAQDRSRQPQRHQESPNGRH